MAEYIVEDPNGHSASWRVHECIVRCRDCKHASEGHWPAYMEVPDGWLDCIGPLVTVWDYRHDRPANNPVKPDGFCAWGERRDA